MQCIYGAYDTVFVMFAHIPSITFKIISNVLIFGDLDMQIAKVCS